ncbi:MAG: hypothetical protein IT548_07995 [Alphaproteobacteria bacterium]|nr:hypothetical protein [Alphaproteobacteria bacterium]
MSAALPLGVIAGFIPAIHRSTSYAVALRRVGRRTAGLSSAAGMDRRTKSGDDTLLGA